MKTELKKWKEKKSLNLFMPPLITLYCPTVPNLSLEQVPLCSEAMCWGSASVRGIKLGPNSVPKFQGISFICRKGVDSTRNSIQVHRMLVIFATGLEREGMSENWILAQTHPKTRELWAFLALI